MVSKRTDVMHKIHNDDALNIVGNLDAFDYLITDPPYPVGGNSSMVSVESKAQVHEMMHGMASSLLCGVMRAIKKKPDFCAWIMCDWRIMGSYRAALLKNGFDPHKCLIWNKVVPRMGQVYMSVYECVLVVSNRGALRNRLKSIGEKQFISYDVFESHHPISQNKSHPFEKPPDVVHKMLGKLPKGRVLDPFCGSGGLLVGAKQLGHEAVGIEIVEKTAIIAQQRLDDVMI